jgi:hypothetical protein
MKVLHYFSQNRPTLATDLRCNRHFIQDRVNGELVAVDEQRFAEALHRWICDENYLATLRQNLEKSELGGQSLANRRMAQALAPFFHR